MTHDDAFLADIREHPEDDTSRLVYADWLEDHGQEDRATFIRVQIEWARRGGDGVLRQQAEELLQAHWDEWVRPLAEVVGNEPGEGWLRGGYHPEALVKFRRGFVSLLDMQASRFVDRAADLFRLAPIRHLRLRHAGEVAGDLARCPFLCWLEDLEFIDYYSDPIDARAMADLADSPHLGRLRFLKLYNNHLGDDGAVHLARAPWLSGVEVLEVGNNGLSARGVTALAQTEVRFRPIRLRLGQNEPGVEGLAALGNSPVAGRLALLGLDSSRLGPPAATALAAAAGLSALRVLDLDYNPLGDQGAVALARAGWMARLANLCVKGCGLSPRGEELLARR
jgi:uncharacterized protein (TIGR02996 family)